MAEIDRLEIQIQAQANKANASLQTLINKLDRVSAALSGVNSRGLATMGAGVNKLTNAMANMNANVKTTDFTRLTKNISALANIDFSRLNTVAPAIKNIGKSLNGLGVAGENAEKVGNLAKNLSKLGNKSVQTAITNIPQLSGAVRNMMQTLSTAPAVSNNTIQMTNALAKFASQGSKISGATKSLQSGLNKTSAAMEKTKKSSAGLAAKAGKLYANFYWLANGIKRLWTATDSSMDYVETFNYWNVTMDKIGKEFGGQFEQYGYDSAESYASSFADRLKDNLRKMTGYNVGSAGDLQMTDTVGLGLDPEQLMNYQAKIGAVTNAVGLTGETSTNTAKALSMLSADMSSFTNADLSTVMTNFQSGLIGQSRALYKYGIDITNATLETYAYDNGVTKSVTAMTQAEKMQLRMLAILDQSRVAWGDQANTLGSVANQYRIFKQQISNIGRTIGNLFLPIVQAALPIVNGLVISLNKLFSALGFQLFGKDWLKDLQDGVGKGFVDTGLEGLEEDADDTSGAIDSATNSAKELKNELMGFDEINKLSDATESTAGSSTGGGSIDLSGAITDAVGEYESIWNAALKDAQNTAQEFADKISGAFDKIWAAAEPLRNALKKLWDEGLSKLADFTWTAMGDFYDEFLVPVGNWALGEGLPRLVDILNKLLVDIDWDKLNKVFKETFGLLGDVITKLGDTALDVAEALEPIIAPLMNDFIDLAQALLDVLKPIWEFTKDYILPILKTELVMSMSFLLGKVQDFVRDFKNSFTNVKTGLSGIIDFITGVFTGNWEKAWRGIRNVFISIINTMLRPFQNIINTIITIINKFIAGINSIKLPDWLADLLGIENNGLNIKPLEKIDLQIDKIGETIKNTGKNVRNFVGNFSGTFDDACRNIINSNSNMSADTKTTLQQIAENAQFAFGQMGNIGLEGGNALSNSYRESISTIPGIVQYVFSNAGNNALVQSLTSGMDSGYNFSAGFNNNISGISAAAAGALASIVTRTNSGELGADIAAEMVASLIEGINSSKDTIQNALNNSIGASFSGQVRDVDGNVQRSAFHINIQKRALGGLVDKEQLFIAGEAGPEIVGTMGGKTAVAPRDDIAKGIAGAVGPAVYNAIALALANYGGSGTPQVQVLVGGQEVTDVVVKEINSTIRETGQCPILI